MTNIDSNDVRKIAKLMNTQHFDILHPLITSEAEGRASSTENKGKSWVWATGRPAGRGHAFERLISLEPKARLASGLLWWVPPFLLPCMGPMPNHASTHCGTWRVLPGGMSQMFRLLFLGNGWADCIEICRWVKSRDHVTWLGCQHLLFLPMKHYIPMQFFRVSGNRILRKIRAGGVFFSWRYLKRTLRSIH